MGSGSFFEEDGVLISNKRGKKNSQTIKLLENIN